MTFDSSMPSPPFPSPDNAVLRLVVGNAIASVRSGEASVEEAILHAAVHARYEGHIKGEDECPGCNFRAGSRRTGSAADLRPILAGCEDKVGLPWDTAASMMLSTLSVALPGILERSGPTVLRSPTLQPKCVVTARTLRTYAAVAQRQVPPWQDRMTPPSRMCRTSSSSSHVMRKTSSFGSP